MHKMFSNARVTRAKVACVYLIVEGGFVLGNQMLAYEKKPVCSIKRKKYHKIVIHFGVRLH